MSISLMIKVKPSKIMRNILFLMNTLVFISLGWLFFRGLQFTNEIIIGIIVVMLYCILSFLQYRYWKKIKVVHLRIDHQGNISLFRIDSDRFFENVAATLLADSTCWAFLIILRCRLDDGNIFELPVLSDSVTDREEFRKLSVAINWTIRQTKQHHQQDVTNGNF